MALRVQGPTSGRKARAVYEGPSAGQWKTGPVLSPPLPPRKRWRRLRLGTELRAVYEALTTAALSARIGEEASRRERKLGTSPRDAGRTRPAVRRRSGTPAPRLEGRRDGTVDLRTTLAGIGLPVCFDE